jgi:hypothetical protein
MRSVWNMIVFSLSIEEHADIRLLFYDVHHRTHVHKRNIIVIQRMGIFLGHPVYTIPI